MRNALVILLYCNTQYAQCPPMSHILILPEHQRRAVGLLRGWRGCEVFTIMQRKRTARGLRSCSCPCELGAMDHLG
jgi:hypothetical protein